MALMNLSLFSGRPDSSTQINVVLAIYYDSKELEWQRWKQTDCIAVKFEIL